MNNNAIYTSIIISKTGTEVPLFSSGKSADSKYNPEREAENIISSQFEKDELIENHKTSYFFVVTGAGSGTLLEKLSESFPKSKIISIETTKDNIFFLCERIKKIKKLQENKNIIFTDIDNIENVLINNYLPALYSKFKIIEQRGWVDENKEVIKLINKKINKAIGIISADFSVQTHFGKIWQSNIVNNLKTMSLAENNVFPKINTKKTAAIIAAGPSLDESIKKLILKKEEYFIISTDTSFPVLLKHNIVPEIVISIDGQHISHNHFTYSKNCKQTIFLLDLCSDYSTGMFLQLHKQNLTYFISGHPLSSVANEVSYKKFPTLFSGAGTVTITALDFAFKVGFSNIEIFGADFSYLNYKPYTKGTYFDSIFGCKTSKLNTIEQSYSSLMFRTELIKSSNNEYSTEILSAYKMSLEQYLADNKCIFRKEDYIYKIKSPFKKNIKSQFNLESFSYNFYDFIKKIKNAELNELKYPLLPYIAWLKNKKNNASLEFNALLKLAQSNIVRYN